MKAENWSKRREELYDCIIQREYGGMPTDDVETQIVLRARGSINNSAWPKGTTYSTYELHICFADHRQLSLTLSLWYPPGKGPFPVVLDGDGCWHYFNDEVIRQVVCRGNIAASFDRTEVAADNKDCYRETGLYRLFPDAVYGVLSAWAWAYHRCIDALYSLECVRTDAIAVTGHSRGGKAALLAGATDKRIAVTNPNCSGIGGAGLHQLKAKGSEIINSFFSSGNIFWFSNEFAAFRHRDAELPYDQHFMHAMVAPRRLLLTDAYEDAGANPQGTYVACQAARAVYDLLGAQKTINWVMREGGHSHDPADYISLLDFMDRDLHQRTVKREFQRELFPDVETYLSAP